MWKVLFLWEFFHFYVVLLDFRHIKIWQSKLVLTIFFFCECVEFLPCNIITMGNKVSAQNYINIFKLIFFRLAEYKSNPNFYLMKNGDFILICLVIKTDENRYWNMFHFIEKKAFQSSTTGIRNTIVFYSGPKAQGDRST